MRGVERFVRRDQPATFCESYFLHPLFVIVIGGVIEATP